MRSSRRERVQGAACLAAMILWAGSPGHSNSGHPSGAPFQQSARRVAQPVQPEAVIESASRILAPPKDYPFPNGVTYRYKAEWRLWTAGVASLRMSRDASGAQRVIATADATGFVARLYPVHDVFESVFDPRTFCSQHISKRTQEGFRRRETKILFDYHRRKSLLDDVNFKSGEKKHYESDIPGCSSDVLSGLVYAASLPLEPGAAHTFPVSDGGKTVDLTIHSEAREQITTEAGTFSTLRVQPEAGIGLMKGKGRIWIWYSDDAERIPVQIRGRMGWGTLTLRLERIERPSAPAPGTAQ